MGPVRPSAAGHHHVQGENATMSRLADLSQAVLRRTTRRGVGALGLAAVVLGAAGPAAGVAQANHPGGLPTVPRCAPQVRMCYAVGGVSPAPDGQGVRGAVFVHNADPQPGREIVLSVEAYLPELGSWTPVHADRFPFAGGHGGGYDDSVHGVDQGSAVDPLPFETVVAAGGPSGGVRRYRVHVGVTGTADDAVTGDATTVSLAARG
jgi:hypothetical protein